MRGILQSARPWLVCSWWYAHHVKLACKKVLSSKLSKTLMKCCYIYISLWEVIKQNTRADRNCGRSEGTVWASQEWQHPSSSSRLHKRNTFQRVVDRYEAYISHPLTLLEDSTVKAKDKADLREYPRKLVQYKAILGCALYVDIVKPPSLLSLSLQGVEVDTIFGIKRSSSLVQHWRVRQSKTSVTGLHWSCFLGGLKMKVVRSYVNVLHLNGTTLHFWRRPNGMPCFT